MSEDRVEYEVDEQTKPRELSRDSFDDLMDALDHIARVTAGHSPRIQQWINARCMSAIAGDSDWRELDIPEPKTEADKTYMEGLVDALDHIARTCRRSRTSTRRLRWIEVRADSALDGTTDWRDLDVPKTDPLVKKLENVIASIVPFMLDLKAAIDATEQMEEFDPETSAIEIRLSTEDIDQADVFFARLKHSAPHLIRPDINLKPEDKQGADDGN